MDENEFFRRATLKIFSSLNIETAMKQCMDFLSDYIPVSGMFFILYDPDLNVARFLASIWPPDFPKPNETVQLPMEFRDWIKEQWRQGPGMEIINDIDSEDPRLRKIIRMTMPDDFSHLRMDLKMENMRLGSLILLAEGKNRYTDTHAHLITLLHEPFAGSVSNILQHQEILRLKDMLADDNRYLHQEMLKMKGDTIIGANFGLRDIMKMVLQIAPLDSPVLLMGETGVGKEIVANAIHLYSTRKDNPCIRVNCGAIPENLIDSELFGHERGAFTGAVSRKRGRFERAHDGTIFLDEIGELSQAAQVKLLRVIQQHEIERVGGTESVPVDVRLICATNRDLTEMVRSGKFREDLWFRINVFPITIPPLRRRKEDIPAFVAHFIERKSRDLKMHTAPSLAPGALERLQAYHWPGNVRELENLVERELILSQMAGDKVILRFDHLDKAPQPEKRETEIGRENEILPLDDAVAAHIRKALERSDGKVEGENGAARMLGLHPSTLRGRMRKLRIPFGRKGGVGIWS